jgi:hypothetical protein
MTKIDAYGKQPILSSDIYLGNGLLSINSFPEDVFIASVIIHEYFHSRAFFLLSGTPRGEKWAYQAQSDFLRANGIEGPLSQILKDHPGTHKNFLKLQAEMFKYYNIENPAIDLD